MQNKVKTISLRQSICKMKISGFAVFAALCCSLCAAKPSRLTLLPEAVTKNGAACLDGSPPGYYHRPGKINNWIIHLEGGGWCYTEQECYDRSNSALGSSTYWSKSGDYNNGVLSDDKNVNPDFYDWNSVFVPYCDGISFASNRNETVTHNGRELYFRGHRILNAIIESLLKLGLKSADEAILSGCSAGGLAVYYSLDYVRTLLPNSVALTGLADAGYFLDIPNIDGKYQWKNLTEYAFKMHNTTSGVNQACAQHFRGNESACLSAPIGYKFVSSKVFSFNSQYDTWQLENLVQVNCLPPNCDARQMKAIQNFREEFVKSAQQIIDSKQNGAFLDSCLVHCQSRDDLYWSQVSVAKQTAVETFGIWYFQRDGKTKEVDCAYPCNTCS